MVCNAQTNESIPSVKIGEQTWMTKNLDVSTFANGDLIPEAKTREEWNLASDNHLPAWCYYNNDTAIGRKYGKLYNWYAVADRRGLASKGWHIPSDTEWKKLFDNLGGIRKAGSELKSSYLWSRRGNGNNSSGFTGLPGGDRDASNDGYGGGYFGYINIYAFWWTSTQNKIKNALFYSLYQDGLVRRGFGPKGVGYSVRCIKD
jgi:uncharacterized protein (TIGR02145 family)